MNDGPISKNELRDALGLDFVIYWRNMTRKQRRAFKRMRRPLTQDEKCVRNYDVDHLWAPWDWWMEQAGKSIRSCINCGRHSMIVDGSPEFLNRTRPS